MSEQEQRNAEAQESEAPETEAMEEDSTKTEDDDGSLESGAEESEDDLGEAEDDLDEAARAAIRKRNRENKSLRERLRETEAERNELLEKVKKAVSLEDYEALKIQLAEQSLKAAIERELVTLPPEAEVLLEGSTPEEIQKKASALRLLFGKRNEGAEEANPQPPSSAGSGYRSARGDTPKGEESWSYRDAVKRHLNK